MGSRGVIVDPARGLGANMNWDRVGEDPTSPMQEYMKHSADFQRRLVSVRESRALLEKSHRMRKERASHMGFQFKQILWQMRRAQDDAYLAQARYLKLLELEGGHALRLTKGSARVQDEPDISMLVNRVAHQSDKQVNQNTRHQNEHQTQDSSCAHFSSAEDAADLDLIQGTSFRFSTSSEESNHESIGNAICAAQETQSYLTSTNCNIEASLLEERLLDISQPEHRGELEPRTPIQSSNLCGKDDFVSTSLFVRGDLDSHEFFLEQRKRARKMIGCGNAAEEKPQHPEENKDQVSGSSWVPKNTDAGNETRASELDVPVSSISTTPRMEASTPWDTPRKEASTPWDTPRKEGVEDVQKRRCEDARKQVLKIQRNDFLSQKIAKELDDFTKNPSLGCYVSKPIKSNAVGDALVSKIEGAHEAESTAEKSNMKAVGGPFKSERDPEESKLTTEDQRKVMKTWQPKEKLGVLMTITNTMFLWEVEDSSQDQKYGNWPECQLLVSAAHAARGGQRELFEFMQTVGEKMSKPMVCCGAVCEILKAYPPEQLLPLRFIEDFFAYASKGAKPQRGSARPIEGLTFEHLEVYQEDEHTKFWQMLVHHVVSVKDHNLASFRQIARLFVEILLPSSRMEDYPAQKVKNLHQELLQFLVAGFRSKARFLFRVHYEDDEPHPSQERRQHTSSKDSEGKCGSLSRQTVEAQRHLRQAGGLPTGHRPRRSSLLRPVASRKGLLSCFGSNLRMVRTNFRIWRLKALSRGVDTADEAVVSLLRSVRD